MANRTFLSINQEVCNSLGYLIMIMRKSIHNISPEGTKIAYSAKKNGYWDIYILDLATGQETRITNSPEYEGNPTWSPDSQFLAYKSYKNRNLDIFIQPLNDLSEEPIQLTESTAQEFSPSWSPNGRQIAYVSTISGEEEIWLAKLDVVENRLSIAYSHPGQTDHKSFLVIRWILTYMVQSKRWFFDYL